MFKLMEYCRAYEALNALNVAIKAQLVSFDPKLHLSIMSVVFRDVIGEFNMDAKVFYPRLHKHWNIPLTKTQLSLVFYYLREKKFDYELKLLYNKLYLPWYWKIILRLRSYTWTKKQLQ